MKKPIAAKPDSGNWMSRLKDIRFSTGAVDGTFTARELTIGMTTVKSMNVKMEMNFPRQED